MSAVPHDDDGPEAFEHLYGLGYRLLVPVVPGIGIAPDSPVFARRGKGPGLLGPDGWHGMRGWQQHEASDGDLVRWSLMGAGTGIRTGRQPDGSWLAAIDADTLHRGHALTIAAVVVHSFGSLPMRIGNAPKALFPIRLSAPLPYLQVRFDDGTEDGGLVEVLGENRHFVAAGTHPKTSRPYTWPDALVAYAALPIVEPAAIEAFLARLRAALPNAVGSKGAFASAKNQAALRGDPDLVRRAVEAIPNTNEHFRSRQSWIVMGCAIRAAVEDEFQALDIWAGWSARWVEGQNDPDEVVNNWGRIRPPFQIGASFLYDMADRLTGSGFKAASFHEEVPEPNASSSENSSTLFQDGSNEQVISEDEAGIQFAEEHRGKLRFSTSHGRWFVWDGVIWRENATNLAFHRVREHIRRMAALHPEKVRIAAGRAAFANAVERYARADPAFAVTADAWDRDPWLLGTPGGTVNLRTGELRPARPEDGITRSTAVAPADAADCPLWLRLLDETFAGDAATVRFFGQWCGYSLTGDTREQSLVYAHGKGGNGKGLTLNTVGRIAGTYTVTAAAETFVAGFGTRHSTELAMLAGARIVKASEMERGQAWAEKRIKELTGGDEITARFMRQDNFTYLPAFKLTIMGNSIPDLHSVDDAMRRRFNLLPFVHTPAKPDRRLEEKLKPEWPAILRWMLDGCLDWQANGLSRPETVAAATAAYFAEQDTLGQWAMEHCTVDRNAEEATSRLYEAWSRFAKAAGVLVGSEKAFAQEVKQRFDLQPKSKVPLPTGGRARGFVGIALRAASFQDAA